MLCARLEDRANDRGGVKATQTASHCRCAQKQKRLLAGSQVQEGAGQQLMAPHESVGILVSTPHAPLSNTNAVSEVEQMSNSGVMNGQLAKEDQVPVDMLHGDISLDSDDSVLQYLFEEEDGEHALGQELLGDAVLAGDPLLWWHRDDLARVGTADGFSPRYVPPFTDYCSGLTCIERGWS